MLLELTLFHFSFFVYTLLIFYFKEYKRSTSIFLLIVITIFYSPVIYYTFLNGEAYRVFNNEALAYYINLASSVFIQLSLVIIFKNSLNFKNKDLFRINNNLFINIYTSIIIFLVLVYLIIYFKQLPFYQAIKNGVIIDRPDSVGYLPYYFTFTIFSNFLVPGFYFYYIESINKNKIMKIFTLLVISLILVAGGNKGLLVYFYIFIWLYEYKLKIKFKTIMLFLSLFWIYSILQKGTIFINRENIEYLITSPFRRFFVSQGSGFLVRVQLIIDDFDFGNIDVIKNYIHGIIYGYSFGGSSPTYFMGDLLIKYGLIGGSFLHLLIIIILFVVSRYIDVNHKNNLFILWNFFVVLYLLGMAEISEAFFLRFILLLGNMSIFYIATKITKYRTITKGLK